MLLREERGFSDQQYRAEYNRFGKLKVTAEFNSIPLNYAYNTLTPWQDQGNNVWRLDAATRTAPAAEMPSGTMNESAA